MRSRLLLLLSLVLCMGSGFAGCKDSGDDEGGAGTGTGTAGGRDGGTGTTGGGSRPTGGGSGPSGGSITPPAGVDGDSVLSELSESEILDLCDSLNMQLDGVVSDEQLQTFGCTFFALLSVGQPDSSGQLTVEPAACEQAVDECLSSGAGMESTSTASCDPDMLLAAAAGCTTTVNDLTACLGGSVEQLEASLEVFTCEGLSDPTVAAAALAASTGDPASTPECAPIVQDCPALLDTRGAPAEDGCDETCDFAGDGECDDGGDGAFTDLCALGTDCTDCGPR